MSTCCGPGRDAADPGPSAGAARPDPDMLAALVSQSGEELRMTGLAANRFRMGSQDPAAYPDDGEGPVREVAVGAFALATTTVTVAQFAAFVADTEHRTDAETHGGSLVFEGALSRRSRETAPAVARTPWWRQVNGANWYRPEGPGSTVLGDDATPGRADHPVTHVSWNDAEAYAAWLGARLPDEAEWEFAARGGLDQQPYPWGSVRQPGGRPRMNTFSGQFPHAPTGPVSTMPVVSFPPNDYGLYNMTGNVWEWTTSPFGPADPRPVMRGGSYLCHASYCRRYRTSARTAATADTSLGHTGFRVAIDVD